MANSPSRQSAEADAGDDLRLIARIRDRDVRAFEELYRRYHPRLTRFLLSLAPRRPVAEEVLSDTMMVVWNRPDSFSGASKLSTWIFAIAYRQMLKALRRQDQPIEDKDWEERISPEAGPDERLGRRQVQEGLFRALAELSPAHRAVVDLTYYQELGYRDIAEILDCPVDTVKTRMFHARRHLKRRLAGGPADWL